MMSIKNISKHEIVLLIIIICPLFLGLLLSGTINPAKEIQENGKTQLDGIENEISCQDPRASFGPTPPIQEACVVEVNSSGRIPDSLGTHDYNTSIIFQYGYSEVWGYYSVSGNTIKNYSMYHTSQPLHFLNLLSVKPVRQEPTS